MEWTPVNHEQNANGELLESNGDNEFEEEVAPKAQKSGWKLKRKA
jgi:hypothetical protein